MITKKHNHSHFWIQDEVLYETYKTIRGPRYSVISQVPSIPDNDNCSEELIEYLNGEPSVKEKTRFDLK